MKVVLTYKKPFETHVANMQINNITLDRVSEIGYNDETDNLTIKYGSPVITVSYKLSQMLVMILS